MSIFLTGARSIFGRVRRFPEKALKGTSKKSHLDLFGYKAILSLQGVGLRLFGDFKANF